MTTQRTRTHRAPAPRRLALPGALPALALLSGLGLAACSEGPKTPMDIASERMVRSEAVLLAFNGNGWLKPLGEAAMNLDWPGQARGLFEEDVLFQGLVEEYPEPQRTLLDDEVELRQWQVAEQARLIPASGVSAYGSLFEQVDYFKKAKFKIHIPVPTWRDPQTMHEWECTIAFAARAHMKDGDWADIDGKARVLWRLQPESVGETDPNQQVWRIAEWRMMYLKVQETDRWLFEDVLADVIPDAEALQKARFNIHEDNVRKFLQGEFTKPYPTWQIASGERHPTVAVVDLDRDGFDDFYVQEREGKNLFFRNNGDGTFSEKAAELGLDFDGKTSATVFADFDNDGDLDAFVGGSLRRSMLLENVGGRFVNRSAEKIAVDDLPYHVSMLNAVDYDGDGLLDIYVSTYAAFFVQRAIRNLGGDKREGKDKALEDLRQYLTDSEWEGLLPRLKAMVGTDARFMDRPGPPNVMLKNMGDGRFVRADLPEMAIFYNSFATSWADYDNDGDPDAYVANDFAPNQLMRNEGGGRFTPMSEELDVVDVGFGMGVTWGDYDGDGLQDVYVTNMFSKANRRVTSFFLEGGDNFDASLIGDNPLDPVYAALGAGNSLFRNRGNEQPWEKTSGMSKPKLLVEAGGWGWGAMFADFDNDGWLDLYGPAGYYSAPEDQAISVDL